MPTVKKRELKEGERIYSTLAGDAKAAAEKKASEAAGKPLRYDKDLSSKVGAHRFVAVGAKGMRYSAGGRNGDPKKEKESTSPAIGFSMEGASKKEQKKIDKAAAKKEAKQEKEDKKGMIPAKYRNRGQAGIDRYIADQRRKKARKKRKGLAKIFGGKAMRQASKKARKAARAAKRRMSASKGAGCQGKGCGAYE